MPHIIIIMQLYRLFSPNVCVCVCIYICVCVCALNIDNSVLIRDQETYIETYILELYFSGDLFHIILIMLS